MKDIRTLAGKQHFSRWDELPKFDVYMDQLTGLLELELGDLSIQATDVIITNTMVNNYVKQKLFPAPVKKRYTRQSLSALMYVSLLKTVLSLQELATLRQALLLEFHNDNGALHDFFCLHAEEALQAVFGSQSTPPPDLIQVEMLPVTEEKQAMDALSQAALSPRDRSESKPSFSSCQMILIKALHCYAFKLNVQVEIQLLNQLPEPKQTPQTGHRG